ncbi:lon protease, peroxisomal [Physcia stellaris]|nr:lon protease, peroxisomal [Physcia stellaris]
MPRPNQFIRLGPLLPNYFKPPKGEKPIYLYAHLPTLLPSLLPPPSILPSLLIPSKSRQAKCLQRNRPDFVITLLRTPLAPPTWASFHTPLWFSKLDIKDYLYHCYGLKVLSVRSYVIQRKVRMDKEGKKRPVQNRWFRPQSLKKMTVELAQTGEGQGPFVWPEDPEDKSPYVPPILPSSPFSSFPLPLAISALHLLRPTPPSSPFTFPPPAPAILIPLVPPPFSPHATNTLRAQQSWQKEQFDKANDLAEANRKRRQEGPTMAPTDGEDMAKQAKALLEGKEKWRPGWKDYGVGGPGRGATARM